MKKGLIVILIFLVIVSITGVGLAAKPTQLPTPPPIENGLIADLQDQIDTLTADNTALQAQVTQLTADKAALQAQVDACDWVLETPVLISPDDEILQPEAPNYLPVHFTWNAVPHADSYKLEVYYYYNLGPEWTTEWRPVYEIPWVEWPSTTDTYFDLGFIDYVPGAWRVTAEGSGYYQDSQPSEWHSFCFGTCTEPWFPEYPSV
jgi:hypothetical protein